MLHYAYFAFTLVLALFSAAIMFTAGDRTWVLWAAAAQQFADTAFDMWAKLHSAGPVFKAALDIWS